MTEQLVLRRHAHGRAHEMPSVLEPTPDRVGREMPKKNVANGAPRLLRALVVGGLDLGMLEHAAALVAQLDEDACDERRAAA
jgi:hypothetical protein